MSIKVIIFDIGGVLLLQNTPSKQQPKQPSSDIFKYINRSGLGISATRGQISTQEVWKKVSEHFNIDMEQLRMFEADQHGGERLNTELADFLKSQRPRYKTALLSNAWPGAREAINSRYELDKLVDRIFFSYEEGVAKPDAKFYLLALHHLGIQGNDTIFVDDKIVNVEGASLLGMRSILYRDNEQVIADINKIIKRHA